MERNEGNGGKWVILRNCLNYILGNVEELCEISRKWEKNQIKMRQSGTNSPFLPIPFFSFFHSLTTFPSRSFDEFCEPNSRTGKMENL